MIINKSSQSKRLLTSIGDIDDSYLDEAEVIDVASKIAKRKRVVKYSAIGAAAASVGIAAAILILRPKRTKSVTIINVADALESLPEFA